MPVKKSNNAEHRFVGNNFQRLLFLSLLGSVLLRPKVRQGLGHHIFFAKGAQNERAILHGAIDQRLVMLTAKRSQVSLLSKGSFARLEGRPKHLDALTKSVEARSIGHDERLNAADPLPNLLRFFDAGHELGFVRPDIGKRGQILRVFRLKSSNQEGKSLHRKPHVGFEKPKLFAGLVALLNHGIDLGRQFIKLLNPGHEGVDRVTTLEHDPLASKRLVCVIPMFDDSVKNFFRVA